MGIALAVRSRANCTGNRVGAVIALKSRIVSTGYNGTPSGMPNCDEGGCDYPSFAVPCAADQICCGGRCRENRWDTDLVPDTASAQAPTMVVSPNGTVHVVFLHAGQFRSAHLPLGEPWTFDTIQEDDAAYTSLRAPACRAASTTCSVPVTLACA